MSIYVDTSAFIVLSDVADSRNASANQAWSSTIDSGNDVITSSFVLIECICLLHARIGTIAVHKFLDDIIPIVRVIWTDPRVYALGVSALLASPGKGGPSLIDCVSFETIRACGINDVFAYDKHFEGRGYNLVG